MTKKPRTPEKTVQRDVVQLLRAIGGQVWELGHKRSKGRPCPHCKQFVPNHDFSTRQTPGIPDIYAIGPHRTGGWYSLWVECKADGGRLSQEQLGFQESCKLTRTWHVVGGLDDVITFLLWKGVISERNVAHYRVPKAVGS